MVPFRISCSQVAVMSCLMESKIHKMVEGEKELLYWQQRVMFFVEASLKIWTSEVLDDLQSHPRYRPLHHLQIDIELRSYALHGDLFDF